MGVGQLCICMYWSKHFPRLKLYFVPLPWFLTKIFIYIDVTIISKSLAMDGTQFLSYNSLISNPKKNIGQFS